MVAAEDGTHPGTTGGEPFGDGIDDDNILRSIGVLPEGLQGLAGIDKFTVRLVANDEQVVLLGNVAHEALLFGGQHNAGGVARVGADNGAGVLIDLRLDFSPVSVAVSLLGGGGDGVDAGAGGIDHGGVVGIEGLRNQNLVSVIQNALENDRKGLGAAGGDENFILFKVHVQVVIILLNSVDQLGHTRGGSVFQNRLAEIPHGLKKLRRGLHVGLANVQMIDLTAFGFRRHCIGMELPHRGQTAFFDFAGKLHVLTSVYILFASAYRANIRHYCTS